MTTTQPEDQTKKMIYKEYYGINSLINAVRYAKNIRSGGYPARVSKTEHGYSVVGDK